MEIEFLFWEKVVQMVPVYYDAFVLTLVPMTSVSPNNILTYIFFMDEVECPQMLGAFLI